jgi:NTE family protein
MRFAPVRLHLISGVETLGEYGISSKFNPELAFLQHLHEAGVQAAERWLAEHGDSLGQRSTLSNTPVFYADLAV